MEITLHQEEKPRDATAEVKSVQIVWPQADGSLDTDDMESLRTLAAQGRPHYKVTIEHLADNDELVILVDDGSGEGQPECVWSSVGLDQ
jgi:predicted  nucleic acid-binding Zn-ribbon protein